MARKRRRSGYRLEAGQRILDDKSQSLFDESVDHERRDRGLKTRPEYASGVASVARAMGSTSVTIHRSSSRSPPQRRSKSVPRETGGIAALPAAVAEPRSLQMEMSGNPDIQQVIDASPECNVRGVNWSS